MTKFYQKESICKWGLNMGPQPLKNKINYFNINEIIHLVLFRVRAPPPSSPVGLSSLEVKPT